MKESVLVNRLLKRLNAAPNCKAIKYHGSLFSRAGEPDLVGSYRGQAFVIEAKVEKNKPTRLQRRRLKEWERSGAVSAIAREDFDVTAFLKFLEKNNNEKREMGANSES